MSVKWTARVLSWMLTIVFMTQPGFAATVTKSASKHGTSPAGKQRITAIQARGEEVGAGVRLKYEGRLATLAQQIDVEARTNAAAVTERMAVEFGVKESALTAERQRGGSWGHLLIAHTLCASMRSPFPASQVVALHRDGMAWTMVAHGVGLDVNQFVSAVEAESRVATGDARADGRVRAIGPAGSGTTSVNE